MNTEKIYFDNATLETPSLAQGTIERTPSKKGVKTVTFSIHPKVVNEIGAELFVHEFNEVAIFDALCKISDIDIRIHLSSISHNLNVEGDNGFSRKHNLLRGYIRADKLPTIDRVFTPEETNEFRKRAWSN